MSSSPPENCLQAVEEVLKTFGRLDALVNKAGRNHYRVESDAGYVTEPRPVLVVSTGRAFDGCVCRVISWIGSLWQNPALNRGKGE
jgi:NAD(P)-dependent dehydrogenase (short-subunit alcohol dehydrogenase family)